MTGPSFPLGVYAKRRETIAKKLRPNADLLLYFNAPVAVRNNDNEYPYRADSSFYYLTGFHEPHSVLMLFLEKKKGRTKLRSKLFCQKRDTLKEIWTGKIIGPDRAQSHFGFEEAHPIEELESFCIEFFKQTPTGVAPRVFSNAREHPTLNEKLEDILESIPYNFRSGRLPLEGLFNVGDSVRRLRLIKDKHEIKMMEEASKINVEAHKALMKKVRPGLREYQVQAEIEYEFRNRGAHSVAYGSICAAGENACCLHYSPDDCLLKKGELLLVDAGCELHHYASDITRTLPISGRFSKEQREVVNIVADAHKAAIAISTPGTDFSKIHETASMAIIEGLKKLKFLKGKSKDIYEKGEHRKYFPHGTGHWMGLDVHDPCPVYDEKGKSLKLKAGMVFTVEPGIYFQPGDKSVPKAYRGIGVRIEDDILVTNGKARKLTEGLPAYADEIEDFMNA